jgi:cytochrome c5
MFESYAGASVMKLWKYKAFWIATIAAAILPLHGCSQDEAGKAQDDADSALDSAAEPAVAVHTAEVAQGEMADVMARGEKVFLANCAACHQPTGTGLQVLSRRWRAPVT